MRSTPKRSLAGGALVLAALTLAAYWPVRNAGYVWDDDWYVTENECLRDASGLARLWIPGQTPQYYPIVFTSFWIEHRLWGLEPFGYHAVNVLLHALNAVLVWRLARALAIPGAWFLGAVFALHPVHVESVAWITERKNVLSGCFYLLAALAFLRFQARVESPPLRATADPPRGGHAWAWYGAALALFLLALLSKTVTCSLPAVLILARLWQRKPVTGRWLALLVPMFVAGLVLALHTAYLERTHVGAQGPDFAFTLAERLQIAGRALLFYPSKLLWPWPLVFVYPRWELDGSLASSWPAAVVLLVAAAAILAYRRGLRGPALALAFFAGSLFPALGFFDVYPMRYSFVADHFQYLASLGILALVVGSCAARATGRLWPALGGTVVLTCLGALTWRQSRVFSDQETLWRETLRLNPGAWMAHANLATVLSERGEDAEALACLQRAQPLTTSAKASARIQLDLALTLGKLGRYQEALEQYLALQRTTGGVELRLAQTLERLGRDEEAENYFRQAVAGEKAVEALVPFGVHLLRRGRPEEAVRRLERFVESHPEDADALMFLADAHAGSGRLADAIAAGERALRSAAARGDARMSELVRVRLGQYRASSGL